MISLVNAREDIITSKKEQSFSKLAKRQLASGKERSKTNLKRIYSGRLERGATQTRSYLESRIYTIPRRTYSNPEAGLKAKLNSTTMAMFVLHIPSIKAIQSISKSEAIPLQTFENFEGGLVDTLKKTRF